MEGRKEGGQLALCLCWDETGALSDHERQSCSVEAVDQSTWSGGRGETVVQGQLRSGLPHYL